ncbi:hypothetical protein GS8_2040 [Geobacillus stearothermophilus]|uniref:Uncharacterized protein n=1 Tax=Geobacillus stearothermophilus TaxID=1422 RepID=A0ABQ7HCG0_GEOSE|nr:hypothetical protein GS8_2040 [Geobacillus stearothermophilus]
MNRRKTVYCSTAHNGRKRLFRHKRLSFSIEQFHIAGDAQRTVVIHFDLHVCHRLFLLCFDSFACWQVK